MQHLSLFSALHCVSVCVLQAMRALLLWLGPLDPSPLDSDPRLPTPQPLALAAVLGVLRLLLPLLHLQPGLELHVRPANPML